MKHLLLAISVVALSACGKGKDLGDSKALLSQRCDKDTAATDPECRDMNPGTATKTTSPSTSSPQSPLPSKGELKK